MNKREKEFLDRLQAAFKIEAKERLQTISTGLIELEKPLTDERRTSVIETIFRELHSLKGASRAVNMTNVEAVCQSFEAVFARLKRKELNLSASLVDTLCSAIDLIDNLISPQKGEGTLKDEASIAKLMQSLANLTEESGQWPVASAQSTEDANTDTCTGHEIEVSGSLPHHLSSFKEQVTLQEMVRISTAKLDSILLQAEEMISLKTSSRRLSHDIKDVLSMFNHLQKEWSKFYPEIRQMQPHINPGQSHNSTLRDDDLRHRDVPALLHYSIIQDYIKSLGKRLISLSMAAEQDHNAIDVMVDNLLNDMKKALMLPFSWLLEIFPRLVRDLSRDTGKEADLVIHGMEIEIDRRILEEIKDPFIHLIRNCVDHGIETREERLRNNKPARGIITINISQIEGNKVEIMVSDDGDGIDYQKIKEIAVKRGLLSHEEALRLEEQEALSLIFRSGFSTSPIITDISGRGLGLAILQEKIKRLGGQISVKTILHKGTSFLITLPLTIATFRGIFVQAAEHVFVLPTFSVERVARVKRDEIKTVGNRETIKFNGHPISFVRLIDVLGFPDKGISATKEGLIRPKAPGFITVLIVSADDKQIAFGIDRILNEEEVLVKKFGKQLSRVKNVIGATVLRSSKVAPILNVNDLVKSAIKFAEGPAMTLAAAEELETKTRSILVVEDSITSRILLKNILESAGYLIKTAVDGIDGLRLLKEGDFDLVVSDIEMPGLNGFELVSKIRSDKKLNDLPIILVTALEDREDRERGIDVGANAYIVKSNFDQSNLLDTVKRLIW